MRRIAALLLTLTSALLVVSATPSPSFARSYQHTLARGVTLGQFTVNGHTVHYVKVNLKRHTLQPFTKTSSFPIVHAAPNVLGAAHHVIAASNGDFRTNTFVNGALHEIDVPHGLYMTHTELWGTGVGHAPAFLEGRNHAWINTPAWNLHAVTGKHSIHILSVNHPSGVTEYTPRGARMAYTSPTQGHCYAKLLVYKRRSTWLKKGAVRSEPFIARHVFCGTKAPTASPGTVVLERKIAWPFKVGQHGALRLGLQHPHVHTIISGGTLILSHGKVVVDNPGGKNCDIYKCPDGYYGGKCPRTALGVKGHYAYIVVVDGKPSNRAGIRLKPLALIMKRRFGIDGAVNLDGGGSAVMWARHYGVVSKPSYTYVRHVMMTIGVR